MGDTAPSAQCMPVALGNSEGQMPVATHTPHALQYVERAMCPHCQRPMLIVRIERLGLGYDMRTFECPQCKREEAAVVKYL